MEFSPSDRSLAAWTLYFCVLFNVFFFGLGSGRVTGFELNGVGGQFSSALGNKSPNQKADFSDLPASYWGGSFSCPIVLPYLATADHKETSPQS